MKTKTSILSACGLAGAILAVGIPVFAQEDYQLADPPAGTTQQQGRATQQQGQQAQEQWQQQQPQRTQQPQQARQQERQPTREDQQAWRQQQRPQQAQQRMQQQQYTRLIAAIYGLADNEDIRGTVQFDRESQGARVVAEIGGLQAEQQYSIRIHQFGDLGTMDAEHVGQPFNPGMDAQQQTIGVQQPRGQEANGMQQRQQAQQPQGQPAQPRQQAQRPLGDLGTVIADNHGNIRVERTVRGIQLTSGESGILGRSVVIHRADDGARQNPVAAGVIGISKDGLPGGQAGQTGQPGQTRTVGQTDRDDAYDD